MSIEVDVSGYRCAICDGKEISIIWDAPIRNGAYGKMTPKAYKMYKCEKCGLIWHENDAEDDKEYYESGKYREEVDGNIEVESFWKLHDVMNLNKFAITGIEIFRNKNVADVGCGAGSFLDNLSGIAKKVVGIEPTGPFLECLKNKGYAAFSYLHEANKEYEGKIDIVVSFDVIEHVDDLNTFYAEIYRLLKKDGMAIIGTPTEYKLMEELCGDTWKMFNYRYQHPWILSENSMRILGEKTGFSEVDVEYHQQYGLSNLIMWLKTGKPYGNPPMTFINTSLDIIFKENCNNMKIGDYIVAYMKK